METNSTLEKKTEKTVYIQRERWLLLGTLLLGVVFNLGWQTTDFARMNLLFGVFALLYLALFYLLNGKRTNPCASGAGETAPLSKNKTAAALGAAIVALSVLQAVRGGLYSDAFDASMLLGMNYLVLPLLAIVHMAFSVRDIPVGREWTVVGESLRGAFILPFTAVPKCFGAIGSLFRKETGGKRPGVLIGLAAGLPLAAVVLSLLGSADAVVGRALSGLFQHMEVGEIAGTCVRVAVVAVLFYSFYWNATWGKQAALPAPQKRDWPSSAFAVVLLLLLAVYAYFAYVQFTYLFGGRLPEGLTYATYAREGFSQLVAVSVINFLLLGVLLGKAERSTLLDALTALMLLANLLLLASAAMRLLLYIGAYGLTMMRILPLWFMVYLAVLNVLFAVRLVKEKTPLTRIAALTLIFYYVALNVPDWGRLIASYNSGL